MRTTVFFLTACLALSSCVTRTYDDPAALMTNHESGPDVRQEAALQAARRQTNDPRRIAALNTLVWDRGYSDPERRYAIDELIKIDEAGFRRSLASRIVLIQNWDTLDYIFKLAEERHWNDFTPTLVRQYARSVRGTADRDRPERAVLEKLNPGKSVEQVIFEVFATDSVPAEQTAAWELLNRITDRGRLIALLDQAPATTPLVIDLKAAAADLHALPANREGVLWLAYLRNPARKAYWNSVKTRVAQLTPEQRQGLELRHLAVLLRAEPELLAAPRANLLTLIQAQTSATPHYLKSSTADGQAKDYPQEFKDWADRLTWGDLLVVRWLATAVRDPQVSTALFTQADADHDDATTEYGGGVLFNDKSSSVTARLYPPITRLHNRKYIAPQPLIDALYTGLAHYHFHAQDYHNSEFAGPGRGDLDFANHLNFNCLVFTFIDHDHLNVDYYQPGGVVIDLGTITR